MINYSDLIKKWQEKGYDNQQINQFIKGMDEDINIHKYFTPESDINAIRNTRELFKKCKEYKKTIIIDLLKKCLNQEVDISPLYNNNYNYCTLLLKMKCLIKDIDISKLKNNNYNKTQCKKIYQLMISKKDYKKHSIFFNPNLRSKDYELLKNLIDRNVCIEYFLDQGYSIKQLEIINNYHNQLIDITPFCNYNSTLEKMHLVGKTIKDIQEGYTAIDKEFLLDLCKKYEYGPLNEIILAYNAGLDIEIMLKKNYDRHQLSVIGKGLYNEIDVTFYANPKYSAAQMEAIQQFLNRKKEAEYCISKNKFKDCDISIILDEKLTPNEMRKKMKIYLELKDKGVMYAADIVKKNNIEKLEKIINDIKNKENKFKESIINLFDEER